MGIWDAIARFLGFGEKVYDDVKESKRTGERDDDEQEIEEGHLDRVRSRFYHFLRRVGVRRAEKDE